MKDFFKKLIAGFVVGVGGILPGLSGGILAVSMGLYKPALDAVSGFFKAPGKNFKFLFPIALGGVIGLISFMYLLDWLYADFRTAVICFFLGLVAGSIPGMLRECNSEGYKKHYPVYTFIGFAVAFTLVILGIVITGGVQRELTPAYAFLGGAIIMSGVLLPGVSISFILIALGLYEGLLKVFTSPPKLFMEALNSGRGFWPSVGAAFGNGTLILFALLGMVAVAVPTVILVKKVIERHHGAAYYTMFGILLATMVGCAVQEVRTLISDGGFVLTWWRVLIYVVLLVGGCMLSLHTERFISFKEEEESKGENAAPVGEAQLTAEDNGN